MCSCKVGWIRRKDISVVSGRVDSCSELLWHLQNLVVPSWRLIQWRFALLDLPQVSDLALVCYRICSLRAEISLMSARRNSLKVSYLDALDNPIIMLNLLVVTKSVPYSSHFDFDRSPNLRSQDLHVQGKVATFPFVLMVPLLHSRKSSSWFVIQFFFWDC